MTDKANDKSLLGFIIFLILLLGWFTFSLLTSYKALQTRTWTETEGTVTSACVKKLNSQKGKDKYKPVISYNYEIGGAIYSSDKYNLSLGYGDEDWAEGIIANYPAASKLTVHYNPENPAKAVIITGISPRNLEMLLISGALFVFLLVLYIRQLRKKVA